MLSYEHGMPDAIQELPHTQLRNLYEKFGQMGLNATWCSDAECLSSMKSVFKEYENCGVDALRAEAKAWGVPVESPSPTQQSAEERASVTSRLHAVHQWKAMSTQQLEAECRRRGIQCDSNTSDKLTLRQGLISRLKRDTFPDCPGPADAQPGQQPTCQKGAWTGPPWWKQREEGEGLKQEEACLKKAAAPPPQPFPMEHWQQSAIAETSFVKPPLVPETEDALLALILMCTIGLEDTGAGGEPE